jgi:DNA (cytosine-5)-methyltransferase 1
MKVYYNEFDPKAGEWLKVLIEQKLIPDGVVDTRSIKDVRANDLMGFTQCHFFAGIGGWSYALKLAGINPNEPLWTGSCPCQPYSQAGKGEGFDDERDLWPVFFNLIKECRPAKVFGEQVERAIKHGWLDRVYADMESENYACGAVILGAHSVSAPHQRQRLYFGCVSVSDSDSERCKRQSIPKERGTDLHEITGNRDALRISDSVSRQPGNRHQGKQSKARFRRDRLAIDCSNNSLADSVGKRLQRGVSGRQDSEREAKHRHAGCNSTTCIMGNPQSNNELRNSDNENRTREQIGRPDGTNNLSNLFPWNDFALVLCRDTGKNGNHKVRRIPTESVLFGLADGVPESVDISRADRAFPLCQAASFPKGQIAMLLKGYGNAIVPELGAIFIKSFMDTIEELLKPKEVNGNKKRSHSDSQ